MTPARRKTASRWTIGLVGFACLVIPTTTAFADPDQNMPPHAQEDGSVTVTDDSSASRITSADATVARNIETLRGLFSAINSGKLDQVITDFAAPSFVRHDLTGAIPGVKGQGGATDFIRSLQEALEGLHLEIVDAFGQDDKVVVRFNVSGRHTGEFFGVPATGRDVHFSNINIYRLEDGRVAETWQLADGWGLVQQLRGTE